MVLLVTGRHHTAARPYHHELGLTTPVISCNGTYIYDYQTNSVLKESAIPRETAQQFLQLAQQHDLNLVMYVTDRMAFSAHNPIAYMNVLARWSENFPADIRPQIVGVSSFEAELANSEYVWKFVAEGDIERINAFAQLDWIQENFTGEQSWKNRIDFSRRGNTKGARLHEFLAQHQIDPQQMIAIGDNHNDISMLKLAGVGVAMANAEAEVKAIADRITKESNNEQGILDVLQEYFGV
jgi:Cof subfamily protein (haloacid dehalogenase superfamily)